MIKKLIIRNAGKIAKKTASSAGRNLSTSTSKIIKSASGKALREFQNFKK